MARFVSCFITSRTVGGQSTKVEKCRCDAAVESAWEIERIMRPWIPGVLPAPIDPRSPLPIGALFDLAHLSYV
jgi:hypothetical protein